jgi:tetratricopeptide (TPR) repeat protein
MCGRYSRSVAVKGAPFVSEKIDRKQLKQPDEFQQVAGKAMEWVAAHQKQVAASVGAVALVVVLAWAFAAFRGSCETQAGSELSQALEIESRPIVGEQAQPGAETFPSKEERTKAALAALEKVRADHGGTTAAQTALAEVGFLKLKSGDAAGAQKDLSDFLAAAAKDHPLRVFAQESLGYADEAQGKLDDAKAAFEKLRELDLPARADFQAARLALMQGKPDAKQQLEKVAKEYPKETDVVREANERLELASLPPVTAGSAAPAAAPEKPAAKPVPAKPQAKKTK